MSSISATNISYLIQLTNTTAQIMPSSSASEDSNQNSKSLHGALMICSWFIFIHIGIWCHNFKYSKWYIVVHIICMSLISAMSFAAATIMLTLYGLKGFNTSIHQIMGFAMAVEFVPIVIACGIAYKAMKNWYGISYSDFSVLKLFHKFYGWIAIIGSRFPLYSGLSYQSYFVMTIAIIADLISFGLFWYLRIYKKEIKNISINTAYTKLKQQKYLKSVQQLIYSPHNNNYFIFANYLYPTGLILQHHPGGAFIIQEVKGREIDRFVYGMQIIQQKKHKSRNSQNNNNNQNSYPFKGHSHSQKFIQLAQQPFAKIGVQQNYQNIQQLNNMQFYDLYCGKQQNLYILYLKFIEDKQYVYKSYQSIQQLGRYFALTLTPKQNISNNNILKKYTTNKGNTRLYSIVSFLLPENIKFMQRVAGTKIQYTFKKYIGKQSKRLSAQLQMKLLQSEIQANQCVVPIFIKKYEKGKFTQQIFKQIQQNYDIKYDMKLSEARGFGLRFSLLNQPKKYIILVAGTGLNPFCDLIDLLYKSMLVEQDHQLTQQILQKNPIISTNFSNNYTFIFYIAAKTIHYIHPITLFQLNELSSSKKLKVSIKLKQKTNEPQKYEHVQFLPSQYRFEDAIAQQYRFATNAQYLICGPNKTTGEILTKFEELEIPKEKYRII